MSRWCRLYAGTPRDPKFIDIAIEAEQGIDRVVYVWVSILDSATQKNDQGSYNLSSKALAHYIRCEAQEIDRILAAMKAAGLIDDERIVKWNDRQFVVASDPATNAERQAKHKAKKKSEESGASGNGNGQGDDDNDERVTRDNEQVTRRVTSPSVYESDSGSEQCQKEGELTTAGASACAREAEPKRMPWREAFLIWWNVWPHKVSRGGKGGAESIFKRLYENGLDFQEFMDGTYRYIKNKPAWQSYKSPGPWMNALGWLDKPAPNHGVGPPVPTHRPTAASLLLNINEDFDDEPSSAIPFERSSPAYVGGLGECREGISLAPATGGPLNLLDLKPVGSG